MLLCLPGHGHAVDEGSQVSVHFSSAFFPRELNYQLDLVVQCPRKDIQRTWIMNTTLVICSQAVDIIRESWNQLSKWIFEAAEAIQALEDNKKAPLLGF